MTPRRAVFIDLNRCCPKGLGLVISKVDAWRGGNNDEIMDSQKNEREHLAECLVCNPGLANKDLVGQLWPGAQVSK